MHGHGTGDGLELPLLPAKKPSKSNSSILASYLPLYMLGICSLIHYAHQPDVCSA